MVGFLSSLFDPRSKWLALAGQYLSRQRCRILAEGYQCEAGSADFVICHGEQLAIVSVRLRGLRHGDECDESEHSADRLSAIWSAWQLEHPEHAGKSARFDVLRLDWYGKRATKPVIRYFPGAIGTAARARAEVSVTNCAVD